MSKTPLRIISRLDVKSNNVIKGVHLEGLRVIGDPNILALNYYNSGVDEIIYMDVVASLYGRNNIFNVVKKAAQDIFVPLTVGGGIRKIDDIIIALRHGADKVAINTQALKDPGFLSLASKVFGNQCIVLSIEAKNRGDNKWEALTDNGREKTGVDVLDWVKEAVKLGVGEILLTSVDKEGTKSGFDLNLIDQVSSRVNIPVIACGGVGTINHIEELLIKTDINAICCASIFHYNKYSVNDLKKNLDKLNFNVRLDY